MGIKLSRPNWLGGNGGGAERVGSSVVPETEEQTTAREAREEAERNTAKQRMLEAQAAEDNTLVGYFGRETNPNAIRSTLSSQLFVRKPDGTKIVNDEGAPVIDAARIEGIIARVAAQKNGGSDNGVFRPPIQ